MSAREQGHAGSAVGVVTVEKENDPLGLRRRAAEGRIRATEGLDHTEGAATQARNAATAGAASSSDTRNDDDPARAVAVSLY